MLSWWQQGTGAAKRRHFWAAGSGADTNRGVANNPVWAKVQPSLRCLWPWARMLQLKSSCRSQTCLVSVPTGKWLKTLVITADSGRKSLKFPKWKCSERRTSIGWGQADGKEIEEDTECKGCIMVIQTAQRQRRLCNTEICSSKPLIWSVWNPLLIFPTPVPKVQIHSCTDGVPLHQLLGRVWHGRVLTLRPCPGLNAFKYLNIFPSSADFFLPKDRYYIL